MLRLEKLEISGFKSFADRTSLIFGEGITCVVGPNGCGKSNIAEAISWVLGEQSPKNLRGGKMEDVIFNGTRDRKPTGMSEVILTLVATEDIAARDSDGQGNEEAQDDETRFLHAIESAERAAENARLLVEQNTPANDSESEGEAAAPAAPVGTAQEIEGAAQADQAAAGQAVSPDHSGDNSQHNGRSEEPAKHSRPARFRRRKPVVVSAGERVTVGRRLYRTGDSEYLMNGRACLLRDIQDLFAGTGLGGAHYAIIEQGRIGQILSSKPLDRRALIEEAAGITRFKSRKRAAELRLESARQNLTRLNDIISEVERQVNSLKRQASKARRYRRLREEIRALLKIIFTADYHRLSAASERIACELVEADAEQHRLSELLTGKEAEHRGISGQSRSSEDALTDLRERASSLQLEADRSRSRSSFEEQQIKELTARIQDLERDLNSLDERLTLIDSERGRRAADLKSLEGDVILKQNELADREIHYQSQWNRLRQAETELEQLRQQMLVEVGTTERLRNLRATAEESLRRLSLKQSGLTAEMERAVTERDEAASRHLRTTAEVELNSCHVVELAERLCERNSVLGTMRAEIVEIRGGLEAIQSDRAASEHRLASLEDLDVHRAYYSDAVQQVLSPEQAVRINAQGTLADFVHVEPQYERLVESLFGRELQCVLVPTIDDALAGAEYIKTEGLGRGAFLVVGLHGAQDDPIDFLLEAGGEDENQEGDEPLSPERTDAEYATNREHSAEIERIEPSETSVWHIAGGTDEQHEQVIRDEAVNSFEFESGEPIQMRFELDVLRAIDLLALRPEIKAVVERAFPEKCAACVVPDIEAALHLSLENNWRIYVTQDGEQVINGRLIVTGAQAGRQGASLLALKREIREISDHLDILRAKELAVSDQLQSANAGLAEVEAEAGALDIALREQEKLVASGRSQLEGLLRDLNRAEEHVRVVEYEIGQATHERLELEARLSGITADLTVAEESRSKVEQALEIAQSSVGQLRTDVEAFSQELSAARAAAAALVERLSAARSEIRRLENESAELEARANRNRVELYESHTRVEQLSASRAEADATAHRLAAELEALSMEISNATETLASLRSRADELDAELIMLRESATAAREKRTQIEVERARVESEAAHLTKSCVSELGMQLEDVVTSVELERAAAQVTDAPAANDGEQPSSQTSEETGSSDYEYGENGERSPDDVETSRVRLDELRVKLDDLGPVNLMALEELEEATERQRFLTDQRRDILDSIKGTEEALGEIKRRSRERFRHAFAHINENFQTMFSRLFGGGRGEMILIDDEDVLESGIDLIAQPPGKRLQNVLLLSGGEKAMAALALVLAIFQYRPSPFCILDEVDAPLDEMNVGRFAQEVVEMSQDTQFLVITHNKRTMEAAGALYGVTMEELGVSKLVSVRFA